MNAFGAAITYAQRGWHVFPLVPRGKVPLTRHGFKDASRDPGLVAAWWAEHPNANVGVACGPSRLLVVDLDCEDAGWAWSDLVAGAGEGQRRTLTAATGKGWHLYFAGEGRSGAGKLGPGIDTRGAGGYVVAPPSVHESGAVYRWLDASSEIAPIPSWVEAALAPSVHPPPVGEKRALPDGAAYTRYGLVAVAALVDEMVQTVEGRRKRR